MNNEITTSEQTAVNDGIEAVGGVFSGITNFMANNWVFAVLMLIPLVGVGVSMFRKISKKFGGKS